MGSFLLFVLSAVVQFLSTAALHEDQVGKWDWYKENIGKVSQVVFPTASPKKLKKMVWVATEQSTIAALNVKTGNLVWRRPFPTHQEIFSIQLHGGVLMALSAENYITAWDAGNGLLLWSHTIDPLEIPNVRLKGFLASTTPDTATLIGIETPNDRQAPPVIHQYTFPPSKERPDEFLSTSDSVDGSAWDGMFASHGADLNTRVFNKLAQVTPLGLLLINTAKRKIIHFNSSTRTTQSTEFPSGEGAQRDIMLANANQSCKQFVLYAGNKLVLILGVGDNGQPQILNTVRAEPADSFGTCSAQNDDTLYAARTQVGENSVQLKVYGLTSGSEDLGSIHPILDSTLHGLSVSTSGSVSLVAVYSFSQESGGVGIRTLISSDDGTLTMVQQGDVVWHRSEGLGDIQTTSFVDLPILKPDDDGDSDPISNVVKRLVAQVTGLREGIVNTCQWLMDETVARAQALSAGNIDIPIESSSEKCDEGSLSQDRFGFRKLIIATSSTPTLYGLHSSKGTLIWKNSLKYEVLSLIAQHNAEPVDINYHAYAQRSNIQVKMQHVMEEHEEATTHHNILLWVKVTMYQDRDWRDQSESTISKLYDVMLIISSLSGSVMQSRIYDCNIMHAMLLPYWYESKQTGTTTWSNPVLLLTKNLDVDVFPPHHAAEQVVQDNWQRIYMYMTDIPTDSVTGYSLHHDIRKARQTWRIAFDSVRGEQIAAVSYEGLNRFNFKTQNNVKLFNNNTDKYSNAQPFAFKYINPNMFAVATSVPASAASEGKKKTAPSIGLYLIDAVTGSIVNHATVPYATPPVKMLSVENFLLFHFYNNKYQRYQMGVWEFFEDAPDSSKALGGAVFKALLGTAQPAQSSFTVSPPLVDTKLVVFPTAVRCLAASVSQRGVTNKMLLYGNSVEKLVGFDLRQFDNPNTFSVTSDPRMIISYNRTIHNIRHISSSPSKLESTSHVIAVGLDIFYTRISPAKAYDLLNEDFSYWLLLLTCLVLLLGTLTARFCAHRKDLERVWK